MPRLIENRRVLVTGGAGFIGSNLTETLLAQGNAVVCLDNFSTGRRENAAPFLSHPAYTLIEGDIRDVATCRRACDGIDCVLHQAALGSVPRSIEDPLATHAANITGFVNLLVAARDARVKRLVYASSSAVYGDSPELPKTEDRTGRPLSPYAVTKYVDELYADVFAKTYDMELVGLRYFNVFGRRQDPQGAYAAVIPRFAKDLIDHRRPVIFGDGCNSRDFTYIDNVIQANQLAAVTPNPAAINTVYNIACGGRTTLTELFLALREALAAWDPAIGRIEPEYGAPRAGDIPHSHADISKARSLLGYDPATGTGDGLRQAAGWYWEQLGNPPPPEARHERG